MSDKALGALRVAVAHDEALRDALRLSEGNRSTEQKVAFYVQVYRYLKDRIRNDIIRSDDPVEAIEEMEIELARLADQLDEPAGFERAGHSLRTCVRTNARYLVISAALMMQPSRCSRSAGGAPPRHPARRTGSSGPCRRRCSRPSHPPL